MVEFSLGYTHPIFIQLPSEVKVETKSERNQNPIITLESADKQLLGLICAKIRSFRKPEPYKGKGVLFQGEVFAESLVRQLQLSNFNTSLRL